MRDSKILSQEFGKVPPQAVDLEENVISTLLNKGLSPKMMKILFPEMFYNSYHQVIVSVMLSLARKGNPVSGSSVIVELKKKGKLEEVGGPYKIALLNNKPTLYPLEYYVRILQQYWLKREIIRISHASMNKSYEENVDPFDLSDEIVDEIGKMLEKVLKQTEKSNTDYIEDSISLINKQKITDNKYYKIGDRKFDKLVKLSPNSLMLFASKSKAGKTKFIIYLMKSLLKVYKQKIFIYWNSLEDPIDKLIRNLISFDVGLTDKEQLSEDYILSNNEIKRIKDAHENLKQFDIIYNHDKLTIKEIGQNFKNFCKTRKDKFNIVIVDNLMLVKDQEKYGTTNDKEVRIAYEIDKWGIKVDEERNKMGIIIHHFSEAQMNVDRLADAYRPRLEHIKGNARIRDIMTHIFLINNPANYPDLITEFGTFGPILEDLFLLELADARDRKTGLLRYFKSMEYCHFVNF